MSDETGFIKRWSQQKLEEKPEDITLGESDLPAKGEVEAQTETPADGDTPPPDLPDIETLDENSDYTPFLGDKVPEKLARMALRKLWLSDPVLANIDGLNDYDDDFSKIVPMKQMIKAVLDATKEDPQQPVEGEDGEATPPDSEPQDVAQAQSGDEEPLESEKKLETS
ncbi:MAG: DUF3306 domain-containing protein, partial [Rhodospirillaceae bacterium]|nr:DUF3306 domain-containing protein [Rhodospirillaceae bacterium]